MFPASVVTVCAGPLGEEAMVDPKGGELATAQQYSDVLICVFWPSSYLWCRALQGLAAGKGRQVSESF